MRGVRIPGGQTDSGRYYNNSVELRRASGRAIRLYVIIEVLDEEVGVRHIRLQWIHGQINAKQKGIKRWEKYLEENLDTIIAKIEKTYQRKYFDPKVKVIEIEGWKIFDPKITRITKRISAWDHSQDRSTPLVDIESSKRKVSEAFSNVVPFKSRKR